MYSKLRDSHISVRCLGCAALAACSSAACSGVHGAAQQIAPVVEEVLFVVTGDCEIYEGFAMWFYAVLK